MRSLPTDPLNCEIMALSLALQREITDDRGSVPHECSATNGQR